MSTSDTEAVADHVNQARDLLVMSREYLTQSDLHQASERGWGAAAHMVKAVAIAQGWEYERHSDFSQVLNSAYLATSDDCFRLLRGITNELHGNYYRRKQHLDGGMGHGRQGPGQHGGTAGPPTAIGRMKGRIRQRSPGSWQISC